MSDLDADLKSMSIMVMLDEMESMRTVDAPALLAALRTAITSDELSVNTLASIQSGLVSVMEGVRAVGGVKSQLDPEPCPVCRTIGPCQCKPDYKP